ncbi:MAG: ROK family protein [Kofleriaceae bacterium]|nr:ROK family protein [Kofleriaceae bacterium]MCL4223756.1 ROK family protein [Myxococcales bacterium]
MSPPRHPWVVGVDLGGSNLRVAAYRDLGAAAAAARTAGRALAQAPAAVIRRPVGSDRSVETIIERIAAAVRDVLAEVGASPVAVVPVGIGLAAMLADRRGTVANSPHLGWRDVAFGPALARRLGPARPVGVYNDVNAITYGEFGVGAGAGARDLLCVFVGTGIGGGLVVNGALAEGATACAGELGHVKVAWGDDAAPCNCGGRGCVEAYVGGAYVLARIRRELAGGARSLAVDLAGGDPEQVHPGHVDAAAAEGDPWALGLWTELAPLFAVALGNAITLLNPDRVVLGGGLLGRTPTLRDQALLALSLVTPPALLDPVSIVLAALGDDAGIVGAALLADAGVSLA